MNNIKNLFPIFIAFVYCPIWILLSSSKIFSESWFSLIFPILPPTLDVLVILNLLAVTLKPISVILFSISFILVSNSLWFFAWKTISDKSYSTMSLVPKLFLFILSLSSTSLIFIWFLYLFSLVLVCFPWEVV